MTGQVKRLEMGQTNALREVGLLKESLKSYDMEEKQMSPNFDPLKEKRLNNLEQVLLEWKTLISTYEKDMAEEKCQEHQELERTIIKLEKQVDNLSEQVGNGEYNRLTTRVIFFDNDRYFN
jgi:hypothetical protein